MTLRLSIPKLAAAAVPALQVAPRFNSQLLQSGATWPQDVNYLRDAYVDVFQLWSMHETNPEVAYNPENDKALFTETASKLRELILGLEGVSRDLTRRTDVFRAVEHSRYDFETAETYARAGDWAMATVYQSYALLKIHRLLDGLTREANSKRGKVVQAAGYDVSGEVMEPGEQESRSPNLWDNGNSPKLNRTPLNPANQMVDSEAENEFGEELEHKHDRVDWPARTR
jgi:hypothetical protein